MITRFDNRNLPRIRFTIIRDQFYPKDEKDNYFSIGDNGWFQESNKVWFFFDDRIDWNENNWYYFKFKDQHLRNNKEGFRMLGNGDNR